VAGFCWGGSQSFRFATNRDDLEAACVFYGHFDFTAEDLARIDCPVFGFYGGNDARITATVPATAASMEAQGKIFEPVIYEGAGHGFMRSGEEPDASEANRQARDQGWARWLATLESI
jgi:carboxymethylenebutenolidase